MIIFIVVVLLWAAAGAFVVRLAYKIGAIDERAKIAAWLQWNSSGYFGMLARQIEAREHLK